jgi:hypothetical protein
MTDQTCHDRTRQSPRALADAVLRAIIAMATESRRREAEAMLAARRAGITASPAEIRHAVDLLLAARRLSHPVELADGGIIVSLPDPGARRTRRSPR